MKNDRKRKDEINEFIEFVNSLGMVIPEFKDKAIEILEDTSKYSMTDNEFLSSCGIIEW